MTEPPTLEELGEWEEAFPEPPVQVLIQEVRRLREERNDALAVEKAAMEIADTHLERAEKAEAERDRYKRAVDDANEELKRGNIAAAESWLRAARQPESE